MKKILKVLQEFEGESKTRLGSIDGKLDERISIHIDDYLFNLLSDLEGCESPIESIFALELSRVMKDSKLNFIGDLFEWEKQSEITVHSGYSREKTYRADFLVSFLKQENDIHYQFVIECDGHEFHERTKEQAARDRQRDRDMLESGIVVIRFTGSEIYENPYKCARQALRIIENQLKQYKF